ncbi:MAG: SUMF1/EgtB/PvdO family nonheme iron enzyme [Verrucomicrobiaceae bacterium]|nr:SUMF1/EgtB/PvdO family nonheme iron enzyme [Verrucomicrobiaceae bacterium]
MPDDPNAPVPSPKPPLNPGPTPTGYQRTQGGGFKWVPPTAEELGKLLPQYEVQALVGRGGMGAVYKGRQKALDRPVAIKILPPEVDAEDESYTTRFKNEAKIMAKLEHPAIVPVHDFGETSNCLLYFVMGFVDGTDVHEMITSQGRLPPEHALAITAHVCDALAYAHKNGVIHRDIKPSNVLINMDGQVKVADFGLAKSDDVAQSNGLTKTGLAMGTPDYVAPETLTMGVNVDGRADLYAVGVMLYQMLTGRVPRGTFDPPSKLCGCDPRFDPIVARATKYEREERYPSAGELRKDLDVILTTPQVRHGGQGSAAIPKQVMAQKPAAKGPSRSAGPKGKSANVPVDGRRVRQNAEDAAGTPDRTLASAPTAKSKTPLLIGIGAAAAIAAGAFVMMGGEGKRPARRDQNADSAATSSGIPSGAAQLASSPTSSAVPIKVREDPKPAAAPISNSKPPISNPAASAPANASPGRAAGPPAAANAPAPTNSEKAPTPANAAQGRAAGPPAAANAPAPTNSEKAPTPANAALAGASALPSPKFPPGQWVKVFTKVEDLPADLRKPERGVTMEDGWIRCQVGKPYRIYVVDSLANYAIRATIQHQGTEYKNKLLMLRAGPKDANEGYVLALSDSYFYSGLKDGGSSVSEYLWKATPPQVRVPRVGEEYTLEFGCVGEKLIGRIGKDFVKVTSDTRWDRGSGYFTGGEPVRDIEVINLDGIPEAEALRILGVDEKGNDLRALAAKQEQQKAEQAKQADAIAAIPELKTLHDQFVKLQAERVTAPFEKDVAALNTSYLGGLDREIEKEKKAGHLDGVLALEAEKKLIVERASRSSSEPNERDARFTTTTQPIPAEDDDATPSNLKSLRKIYRDTFAKHEATRATNLKALTDPLTVRLKQLESTLTQKNRVPDAKVVREYREGLGRTDGSLSVANAQPVAKTPSPSIGGSSALSSSAPPVAGKDGFTNTLGMKFVPVKGTDVLFCIHETRKGDYAAFAAETEGLDQTWKSQQVDGVPISPTDDHPVVDVTWEEATAFCAWLSKKEGRTYRLPTDREWSVAAGIGREERKAATPKELDGKVPNVFPWGDKWPPQKPVGNYADADARAKLSPATIAAVVEGYSDGFVTTAPVMSFPPNKQGLYDMGGNAWEWVADWYMTDNLRKVTRGASWSIADQGDLLSSNRRNSVPTHRSYSQGFRVVLEKGK